MASQPGKIPGGVRKAMVVATAFVATLSAQNAPTFRTGVFLIHVDAEVLGQNGRPITGLGKEDFRVLDDGKEQSIVALSEGEQPLDLILLFDISGSMRRKVKKVAAVAHEGLKELRPGDRVSVMVFNTKAWVVAPFSENLDDVEQAINRVLSLHFRGGTRIQEAVFDAASCLISYGDPKKRRRAVLVITDNVGKPWRSETSIVENFWEADTLLSGLIVRNLASNISIVGLLSPLGAKRFGRIDNIVERTGGDMILSDDLATTFPEMMHRIRYRYTLFYRLPEGQVGSFRKIDVQLSARGRQRFPEARVVARSGYRLRERDSYGFATSPSAQ